MIRNNIVLNALAHRADIIKLNLLLDSYSWEYDKLKAYQKKLLFDVFWVNIENLEHIEPRDKSYFKDSPFWIELANVKIRNEKTKYGIGKTSGSTGIPFRFVKPFSEKFTSGALNIRWYIEHDILGKRFLRMGMGYMTKKSRMILDYLVNIRRWNFFDVNDNLIRMVKKFRPEVIRGTVSSVYDIAKRLKDDCMDSITFIGSENPTPYKKYIGEKFGDRVYELYGGSEFGTAVAFECPEHIMHVNMEGYIVEEIDSELIVTNLLNTLQPFLRYRTGDLGKIRERYKCKCGRTTDIITKIEGRKTEYYDNPYGKNISWWITARLWESYKYIKQWQIIIRDKKTIILKVVPISLNKAKISLNSFKVSVEHETNMNVVIEFVDNIKQEHLKAQLIKIEV